MVMTARPLILGDALYAGWPSMGSVTRARSHPARCFAMIDAVWPRGTWMTTSPSRLRPPVVSESSSHGAHESPSHASHASGGFVGSTPTPSMSARKRSLTALDGTASDSPTYSASPACGTSLNANTPVPFSSAVQ